MKPFVLCLVAMWSTTTLAMDIVKQDIDVDLVSTNERLQVLLRLEVKLTASQSNLEVVAPSGTIDSAAIDGLPATFAVNDLLLVVTPAVPLAAGTHTLQLRTDGVPSCVSARGRQCTRTLPFTFLTAFTELVRWYVIGTGFDLFVGTVTVRVPANHLVSLVQGATPTSTLNADGSQTFSFPYTTPTQNLALVSGELTASTSRDGFVTGYSVDPATRPTMERLVADVARFYPVYSQLYGPLPLSHVSITFVPSDFVAGAMSEFGLIFANEVLARPELQYVSTQFAHEAAHFWWGNLASPQVPFLSEGMAEYSLWRAREVLDGPAVAAAGRRMNATWYLYGRGAVGDRAILDRSISSSPAFVFVTYHKAAVVLRSLEEFVGTDAMTRGLRAAVQSNPDLSVDAWLAAIQKETTINLAPWRRAWLEQPGFPVITVESAVVASGAGQRVSLSMTLSGDFPMKAPLLFRFADGSSQRRAVSLSGHSAQFTETFDAAPLTIEFDPEWTSVREVVPALVADVTLDGDVDGADLIEVALHMETAMPTVRRQDGRYEPLFDLDGDRAVSGGDLDTVVREVR
jgi:hypothetical protein